MICHRPQIDICFRINKNQNNIIAQLVLYIKNSVYRFTVLSFRNLINV